MGRRVTLWSAFAGAGRGGCIESFVPDVEEVRGDLGLVVGIGNIDGELGARESGCGKPFFQ